MKTNAGQSHVRKSFLLVLAALFLPLFLLLQIKNGQLQLERVRLEHQALSLEVLELQRRNELLLREVERLRSDAETIEKVAREELHLARPGEVILRLTDDRERKNRAGPPR